MLSQRSAQQYELLSHLQEVVSRAKWTGIRQSRVISRNKRRRQNRWKDRTGQRQRFPMHQVLNRASSDLIDDPA
jgi:hypothetical protein